MLPQTAFQELLEKLDACEEGRRYVGSRTLAQFWGIIHLTPSLETKDLRALRLYFAKIFVPTQNST